MRLGEDDQSVYDISESFEFNSKNGPFGGFADNQTYDESGPPKYEFLGAKVNSLFGVSACPATLNSKYVNAAWAKGFDILTSKSVRSIVTPANPFPNLLMLAIDEPLKLDGEEPIVGSLTDRSQPLSVANSFGNNGPAPEVWMKDFGRVLTAQPPGKLLIISVVGTIKDGFAPADYHQDFAETAGFAVNAGAKFIELNLSCPNVASEGVVCYTPEVVLDICKRTRAKVGNHVKILAKIGYFSSDQDYLLEHIVTDCSKFIDGWTVINTLPARIIDQAGEQAFPGKGREKAGVSGASIKWAGLEMVKKMVALRSKYKLDYSIIGVGGILTVSDYEEYLEAGADAAQSAAGTIWNPSLAAEIKKLK